MDTEKDIEIEDLFTENGTCLNPTRTYFDDDGDVVQRELIQSHYKNYPADSDIVRLHYSQMYADETRENYSAQVLFMRTYF